jgi:hypothetical protein
VVVSALPNSSFDRARSRGSILSQLDKAESLIKSGKTRRASDTLQSLRGHLDGCGTSDGRADRGDWIVDCEDQIEVRRLLDDLIAAI